MDGGATWLLYDECRALRARLALVRPFVVHESMLLAAAPAPQALVAIERLLIEGRRELRGRLDDYLDWLAGPGAAAPAAEQQRRFVGLRWRFTEVLAQFDTFQEVVTQRSETGIGLWLSGLDVAAADALRLPVAGYHPPPAVCYLDRGQGAAIRRARTRLAGGDPSPVAIIRIPRERMVGHGVASSLVHEVGHQMAASLGLVPSVQAAVTRIAAARSGVERTAWEWHARWLGEVVPDVVAVATVGVAATLGLVGVVSLPRVFVFRLAPDDPHPFPWIRVHLSCAAGEALYPHPQWARLGAVWDELYPPTGLDPARRELVAALRGSCAELADVVTRLRPPALGGRALRDVMPLAGRSPDDVVALWSRLPADPDLLHRVAPCRAFTAVGQARVAGALQPEDESRIVDDLLTRWAVGSTLAVARAAASVPQHTTGAAALSPLPA